MGKNTKRLKGKSQTDNSPLKGASKSSNRYLRHISFSFKDMDTNQYLKENFENWNSEDLLLKLINKIKDVSKLTRDEATAQNIIKIYGSFPPSDKTEYSVPSYLNEELQWGVLHVQGKEVVAGHMIENIFYIVFLDKEHKFWISTKKNT